MNYLIKLQLRKPKLRMPNLINTTLLALIYFSSATFASESRLIMSGGTNSFEGVAGGGITPWALIGGYASEDEIDFNANAQWLDVGTYRLKTAGVLLSVYDRVELSLQKQSLSVSTDVLSDAFALLTNNAVTSAPGTKIEQDIVGLKVRLFGDAIFADYSDWPQISIGLQYKKNRDMDTSLAIFDGSVPLPSIGVPRVLGAQDDSGIDVYLSATKIYLGAAGGSHLLTNVTLRGTKANAFGLLGFESPDKDDFELEYEGSVALIHDESWVVGLEFRTQSDNLGVLAPEKTVWDVFVAWFPTKQFSATLAWVDLGTLPFEEEASGVYLSLTGNF